MPIIGLDLSDQQIFDGINAVLPAWILLVIAPRWRVTHWIVNLTAFGFCLLYTGASRFAVALQGNCRPLQLTKAVKENKGWMTCEVV